MFETFSEVLKENSFPITSLHRYLIFVGIHMDVSKWGSPQNDSLLQKRQFPLALWDPFETNQNQLQ